MLKNPKEVLALLMRVEIEGTLGNTLFHTILLRFMLKIWPKMFFKKN